MASALFVLLMPSGPFQRGEARLFDIRLRLRNALAPSPISRKILVIGIDERDYFLGDRALWTRAAYADLLEELARMNPEAVIFDILFISPRDHDDLLGLAMRRVPTFLAASSASASFPRTPGRAIPPDLAEVRDFIAKIKTYEELWSVIERLLDLRETLREERESLERAQRGAETPGGDPRIEEHSLRIAWIEEILNDGLSAYFQLRFSAPFPPGAAADFYDAQSILLPSAPLMRSSAGAGFINVKKRGEDVIRRIPLVTAHNDRLYPSLDLMAILHHYGAEFSACRIRPGHAIEFPIRRNGSGVKRIPIDERGQYLVNFRMGMDYIHRDEHRTLSFYVNPEYRTLRNSAGLAELLRGSMILIGDISAGSVDQQPVPIHENFPLVGLHANVLDNILKDDYIREAPLAIEVLLALLFGAALGLLFAEYDSRRASRAALGLGVLYALGAFAAFLHAGNLVLPMIRVLSGGMLGYVLLMLYTLTVTERDRRLVKEIFLKSVSPRIGEEILKNFNDPSLWASRRRLSVLFVDIRGFTTMSERLTPEALVALLDNYYDAVSEKVFACEGQVNKFVGDAVLALFGALPGEPPNHAERALRAAAGIQEAIANLNRQLEKEGSPERIGCGVGVNTGDVVVGAVGRRKIRIEYTALGDVVNTASRLQGQASAGRVLAGEITALDVKCETENPASLDFEFRRLDPIPLKGKTQPVEVFELIRCGAWTPPAQP